MSLVFWYNILSPHQAPFLRCLSALGFNVTVVAVRPMTGDRKCLGWVVPDLKTTSVVLAPSADEVSKLIHKAPHDTIHIMAGARWTELGHDAVRECQKLGCRVGILTEAPDPRGLVGLCRRMRYLLERLHRGSGYDFVLGMGEMGVAWFRRCRYPAARLFPFAYVVEPISSVFDVRTLKVPTALYAGQYIARKGLDILLHAFAKLDKPVPRLRLIGDGIEKNRLQVLANRLGLEQKVEWLEKSDTVGVQREMQRADCTVLPSHHDGWGAVVNESLMVGTPVICSSACGAAEVIREPWLGTVFRSGSVEDLTRALRAWASRGPRSNRERERIRAWSGRISGQAIAEYFAAILQHVYRGGIRPIAPWRTSPLEKPASVCMSA